MDEEKKIPSCSNSALGWQNVTLPTLVTLVAAGAAPQSK